MRNDFGELMRSWRKSRKLSQLELSLIANISSKHISFLETGRAHPSRKMVAILSNALDIPLYGRNALLSASGFTEAYSRMNINQSEMHSVRDALSVMLSNHAPYPALVLDWDWNIVMANEPQHKLTQLITSKQPLFPQTCNILELLFDPNGFRPFIENWKQVGSILFRRIQSEKMIHQDRRSNLIERLMQYPDMPKHWHLQNNIEHSEPMLHLIICIEDIRLKLFSTLASFGTAIDVTMQELVIEQYFPVDKPTKVFFESI